MSATPIPPISPKIRIAMIALALVLAYAFLHFVVFSDHGHHHAATESQPPQTEAEIGKPVPAIPVDQTQAENLPSSAQAALPIQQITIFRADGRGVVLNPELATTEEQQNTGLMFRTSIPGDQAGMLFVYPHAVPVTLWMKNVKIPLDVIFVRPGGQISKIVTTKPDDETPLHAPDATKAVLEINAGVAARYNIRPVDALKLANPPSGVSLMETPVVMRAPVPTPAPPARKASPPVPSAQEKPAHTPATPKAPVEQAPANTNSGSSDQPQE